MYKYDVKYSLVIPCYNESENLPVLVDRCSLLLKNRKDIEVLLIDNGSTDNTHIVLKSLLKNIGKKNLRSMRIDINKGYGFGIISGLKECHGEVIGWTHADLQTDPMDFINAISFFEKIKDSGKVFVKGSRKNRSFKDVIFTWGMSLFEWLILGTYMHDINAQPTVFTRNFFASLGNLPKDFSLDLFIFNEAVNNSYKIQRFPVIFELRLKGKGHNETFLSKLKYSYKTILFSIGLRQHLKNLSK
ncbi:glycosyltransferase family 2 protein [bacterium]|mgnify:CR=1 FL=1|nr:glycosyltransferase family 2 protein [bacterium]